VRQDEGASVALVHQQGKDDRFGLSGNLRYSLVY